MPTEYQKYARAKFTELVTHTEAGVEVRTKGEDLEKGVVLTDDEKAAALEGHSAIKQGKEVETQATTVSSDKTSKEDAN